MSERKNIDRLFQENFKDFEVNAPEGTWANIEAKLDEKKKRRVIPLWWKLSGATAVFLIGFLISKSIYQSEINPKNPVVNQTNSNTTNEADKRNTNKATKNDKTINVDNPIVNGNNSQQTKGKNTEEDINKKELQNNIYTKSEAVATTSNEANDDSSSGNKNKLKKSVSSTESIVTERKNSNHRSLKNKTNPEKNKTIVTESVFEKSNNTVAQNARKINQSTDEKQIVPITNDKIVKTSLDEKNINLDGLKGESNSNIIAQETVKKVNDTSAMKSVVSNVLEELLNEKESKTKQESKLNRWQLTSNVAPVFLGSVSNGSPIDSTLSKNSKSYNTNVGFGIGVSYAVNKKLSVRTGFNKVNMSYNTNDIVFFTGIQSKTLANITPTASSQMIHVENSNSNSNTSSTSLENGLLPFENSLTRKNSGFLKQEIGYLEMPVEMTYNLLDKKFGIKVIGGFSTLFLQDNSITIVSADRDTALGKANNLNDVHFSTNLGLGIKYGFMKSFEFNIEPTVKYQLNTFSENAGNFKPYIFGIYSGISYKF